jgi:methionyl-tRNA synthetase
MVAKNCGAVVPTPGAFAEEDTVLLDRAAGLLDEVRAALREQAFHEALERIWAVIRAANGYIDRQAPWTLRKTDPARMATVLYVLAEVIRRIAILTQPFMPDASAAILDQVAAAPDARDFAALRQTLTAGTPLPPPHGVFPRHVETEETPA